jgi:hypothetical protein
VTPTITTTSNTALSLLALVQPYGPEIDEEALGFKTDPPTELHPVLRMLHTGVRALLTGRHWWATTYAVPTGGSRFSRVSLIELNPNARLPRDVLLLCVEGDAKWDRIHPAARVDLPRLFDS